MKSPQINDLDTLVAEIRQGLKPEYLFFWSHRPAKDGRMGKSCLSQWWPSPFWVDGVLYPTAEHFMMAEKARLFEDRESFEKILSAPTPELAKKLGRRIKGFNDPIWTTNRFEIVVHGNEAKFRQNDKEREFLLKTGDRILVEASPVDLIWGIGLAEDDPRARNPEQWKGLNLLGFALMKVRSKLLAKE